MADKEFVLKLKLDTGNGQQELTKVAKSLDDFDKVITDLNKQIKSTDFGTSNWKELNVALAKTNQAKNQVIDATKKETQAILENENAVENAGKGFIALQRQIRNTRKELQAAEAQGDEKTFKKLKADLDELEDQFEIVSLKSKQFDDALAGIPGPVGQIGQGIKGLDLAFKVLVANPVVAVITALVGLLALFRESLTKTTEGQETLNRISGAFGKILGPIFAIIEKVALPLFEGFAFVIEKVAVGFGKFAKFLGISGQKIKEASENSSDVLKAEAEKQAEIDKQKTEKLKEEEKKRSEERKKRAEEYKKNVQETQKAINAYEEEGLSARRTNRENDIANETAKFEALKAQAIKYGQDVSGITETYRQKIDDINKKYDNEESDARKAALQKEQDDAVKRLEAQRSDAEKARVLQEEVQQTYLDLAIATYGEESKEAQLQSDVLLQIRKNNIKAQIEELEQKKNLTLEEKIQLEDLKQAYIALTPTKKQESDKQLRDQQIAFQLQQNYLAATANALTALGDVLGRETKEGKALAVASSLINTYSAIAGQLNAFAGVPVPGYAIIQAVATGLVGFKAVQDILKTEVSDQATNSAPNAGAIRPRGLARGGRVFGAGTGTSDSIPALLSAGETVINARSSRIFRPLLSTINSFAGGKRFAAGGVAEMATSQDSAMMALNQSLASASQPIKTYVVSTDMTSAQEFERVQKARSTI